MRALRRLLLQLLNLLLLVPVLLVALAPLVNPSNWWLPSMLAFGAPFFLLVPLVFLVVWNITNWRWALLNLLLLLANLGHLRNAYGFGEERKPKDEDFRVVTYNVNSFAYDSQQAERTIDYLRTLKPDILCLQEFTWNYGSPPLDTREYIRKTLGLRYRAVVELLPNANFGMAIYSRFPIRRYGEVTEINSETRNGAMYADIEFYGEILRVYNVHLQSYQLNHRNRELVQGGPETLVRRNAGELWGLTKILLENWDKQVKQLDRLHEHRRNAGKYVLLCGDLNNPPYNYLYRKAKGDLDDTFRDAGSGLEHTFPGKYSGLRIDYILRSSGLNTVDYFTGSDRYSDHRPVQTRLRFDFH